MKESHYEQGLALLARFCERNRIRQPEIRRLATTDRLYHLATCAYYRPERITIMVEKCAHIGRGGRAWSCPGWKTDRTPYGVLQHELGHHFGHVLSHHYGSFFEQGLYKLAKGEKPLSGYLGTSMGESPGEFFREWFAEHFRLFVTNPDLSRQIAPRWYDAITQYLFPVERRGWQDVLVSHGAPERTLEQAAKLCGEL